MLRGALAAAVTPLRDGGDELDADAFAPYVEYLAAAGLDGLLALGTTGEGILLSLDERRRALRLFVDAARGQLQVAAHCGAQTTRDTCTLAADAAEAGAAAVAVIGPPYFALDEEALRRHFAAAAAACAPLPFYVYEFQARSGYAVPLPVLERLRDDASNFVGLKVSDAPWERFERYLVGGLDVFAGPEGLIARALERGAAGAVSGLASALPELVVAAVRDRTPEASRRAEEARRALERFPFQAAAKHVLTRRSVRLTRDVRAPLRGLSDAERRQLDEWLDA